MFGPALTFPVSGDVFPSNIGMYFRSMMRLVIVAFGICSEVGPLFLQVLGKYDGRALVCGSFVNFGFNVCFVLDGCVLETGRQRGNNWATLCSNFVRFFKQCSFGTLVVQVVHEGRKCQGGK